MSKLPPNLRCRFHGARHVRCIRQRDHAGAHLFRCASKLCPGRPSVASERAHPPGCADPRHAAPDELAIAERLNKGLWRP